MQRLLWGFPFIKRNKLLAGALLSACVLFSVLVFVSCEEIPMRSSKGLQYTLNEDGRSYSVTGIGFCTDTDIVIPSRYLGKSVTNIGDWAFGGCGSLISMEIPDSVTSIGWGRSIIAPR